MQAALAHPPPSKLAPPRGDLIGGLNMIEAILNFFYAEPTLTFVLLMLIVLVVGLGLVATVNWLLDRPKSAPHRAEPHSPRRSEINSDWRATVAGHRGWEAAARQAFGCDETNSPPSANAQNPHLTDTRWAHEPRGYGARGKPLHRT